jgi:hypothetical protein
MTNVTIPGDTIAMIETARCQMRQIERLLSGSSTPEAIKSAKRAIARMPSKVALKRALDRAVERELRANLLRSDAFAVPACPA